jgi:nitrogen fixation negative regulator NifL
MSRPSSKSKDADTLRLDRLLAAVHDGAFAGRGDVSTHIFFEIVQQSPLAISITDDKANILYVNPAFETLTGYEGGSVLGRNESILSHRQTPQEVYQQLWATIRDRRTWQGTLVNRRKNGEAYLAELQITPVLNDQGAIGFFLGIHRNVTELHALAKQVHNQKALIESVLDSAPVVVALLDTDRKVLLDNQAYKKLLGDLRGREPAHLFLDALQQGSTGQAYAWSESRGFDAMEVRLDIAGRVEPRWFTVSGTWVDELDCTAGGYFSDRVAGRCCLLLVASEITMLKRQMEQVRMQHLRASLAEQQRIQGMREALSGAIFQLQSPINVIQAASMLSRGTDPDKTREVLEQVLESGRQAMETLRAALPAELQESETSVNVNALLQDVLTLMTDELLAQGVMIDWHPQTILPAVIGRPNQLRSMFMRLVENALLAVAESGKDHRVIRITTRGQGDCVEVLVQDNGPGIPEALRLKVFEPFFTAWQQARGRSGMGLPLVQETVNQHGGVIDISPKFLDGCLVRVTLPYTNRERVRREDVS